MNEDQIKTLLRSALPPVGHAALERDLWPGMLARMHSAAVIRFGWFDWAVAGLVTASLLLFPDLVPHFLYQL
jgi:hypothetical protein